MNKRKQRSTSQTGATKRAGSQIPVNGGGTAVITDLSTADGQPHRVTVQGTSAAAMVRLAVGGGGHKMVGKTVQEPAPPSGEQGIGIPAIVERLWAELPTTGSRNGPRVIDRHQLADALSQAALHAIEDSVAYQTSLENDVTRFLLQPGLTLGHQSTEHDLKATIAAPIGGVMMVGCGRADGQPGEWVLPFSELFPVGLIHGVTRVVIEKLIGARIEDMIGKLQADGKLLTPDMTASAKLARSRRGEGAVDCFSCDASGICSICSGLGWLEVPTGEGMTVETDKLPDCGERAGAHTITCREPGRKPAA